MRPQAPVYQTIDDVPPDLLTSVEPRPPETAVLMVGPAHFRVEWVINPHMADAEGRPHAIDHASAMAGWTDLHRIYEELDFLVHVVPGHVDLPDMVFAANQSFPYWSIDGQRSVVLSKMAHPERREEVPLIKSFYEDEGYQVHVGGGDGFLEGMGDVIWWPGKRLLVAGFGFRTSRSALQSLADQVCAPVICLELTDERSYHLDMALSFLDEKTAIWNPDAFTEKSRGLLQGLIPKLLVPPEPPSALGFACNAHAPLAGVVVLDRGLVRTTSWLREMGYTVHLVDVSEFHRAGGSVFCLKMMLP